MDIKTDDLVLKVTKNIDPVNLDLDKYDDFLEELCGHREFQKEAIKTTIRFLLSEEYQNTEDLAKENFDNNGSLKDFYVTFDKFKKSLEFPGKLACTIDLATATGKSWVMYGISQILLCEGAVDQALILCPSTTIKEELIKKFKDFVTNKNLRESLKSESIKIKSNPRIISSFKTIKAQDICIDNVHKTYSHVSSSLEDSLKGKGERTLVLNDESHHIMNPKLESTKTESAIMKKWKEFLDDKKYNFKYIVGFSGTPYLGNNYMSDVVYRYNIMQAMEGDLASNFVIKKVDYVQKEEAINNLERLKIIYKNHEENRKKWKKATKNITIFITQTINGAEKFENELINFLIEEEKLNIKDAEKKVLVVTSSPKHDKNREILKHVDAADNPVEFIISVSMLTEGWDVKNVFQIVPHEKRAFNSKLLIAQVLGRGLRVPDEYGSEQPTVIVYNHDKWSTAIKDLVYEVMAYEQRARSYIVKKDKDYNFVLHNLNYKKKEVNVKKHPIKKEFKIPEIKLNTQSDLIKRKTTYHKIKEGREEEISTEIAIRMYSLTEVARDIYTKLVYFDEEAGTRYHQRISLDGLKKLFKKWLKDIGDGTGKISEENKNRIERGFDVLKREVTGTTQIKRVAEKPFLINTKDINSISEKISGFQRDKAMIYEDYSVSLSKEDDILLINKAKDEAIHRNIIDSNKYYFKCPLNIVILSYSNEREFGKYLIDKEISQKVDCWIKSIDRGFYGIPYSYRKGTHQKWAKFNPDFFIKIGKDILVIEIKSDEDVTDVNKAKLKYAEAHFKELNEKQKKPNYYFMFLSKSDFSKFFDHLKKGKYKNYMSSLEADLRSSVI